MKVWFITGASRGFGREWTEAALDRGDSVAATARDTNTLHELVDEFGGDRVLALRLDVTDRAAVIAAVTRAREHFGRIDIAVNNAGFGLFGAIEEISEDQARAQMETNVFGALWVTQAVLPIMRAQNSGHIVQVSSIGGITAFMNLGLYHASKWALEGFSQALAQEVAPFGIHVTLIEPAAYSTDWSGSSAVHAVELPEYAHAHEARRKRSVPAGNPRATREALLKVVDAEQPPLRIFLGRGPFEVAKADYAQRIATWQQWDDVSISAHGTI